MHSCLCCLSVETSLLVNLCFSVCELTLKYFIIDMMGNIKNLEQFSLSITYLLCHLLTLVTLLQRVIIAQWP